MGNEVMERPGQVQGCVDLPWGHGSVGGGNGEDGVQIPAPLQPEQGHVYPLYLLEVPFKQRVPRL